MRRTFAILLVCSVPFFSACCSVQKEYVKGDLDTYNAVAPIYLKLIDEAKKADGTAWFTDDAEKARLKRTVSTWKLRIDRAGGD